jgi:hypothetical protein
MKLEVNEERKLIKKVTSFYGIQRFITTSKIANHSQRSVNSDDSFPPYSSKIHSNIHYPPIYAYVFKWSFT